MGDPRSIGDFLVAMAGLFIIAVIGGSAFIGVVFVWSIVSKVVAWFSPPSVQRPFPIAPPTDIDGYLNMIPPHDFEKELGQPAGQRAVSASVVLLSPFSVKSPHIPLVGQKQESFRSADGTRASERSVTVLTYGPDGSVFRDAKDIAGFCYICLCAGQMTPVSIHNASHCVFDHVLLCSGHTKVTPAGICCPPHASNGNGTALPSGQSQAFLPASSSIINGVFRR